MSSLSTLYVKKETLETILKVLEKKNEKGITLIISILDKSDNYGQNVGSWVQQTKEQQKAKKRKFFIGTGKCIWTDGTILIAEKQNP